MGRDGSYYVFVVVGVHWSRFVSWIHTDSPMVCVYNGHP